MPIDHNLAVGKPHTVYRVAAWYPSGGYGGVTDYLGEAEAMDAQRSMIAVGGYKVVHVWRETVEMLARGGRL